MLYWIKQVSCERSLNVQDILRVGLGKVYVGRELVCNVGKVRVCNLSCCYMFVFVVVFSSTVVILFM